MARKSRLIRRLNSYSGRLIAGILLLHLVLLPILVARILTVVESGYTSQFINNVRADAFLLSDLVASTTDPKVIYDYLEDSVVTGHITFAHFIFRQEGNDVIRIGISPKAVKEDFTFGANGDNVYQIMLDVVDRQGEKRGGLQIGYDELPILREIAQAKQQVYFLVAVYSLVMLMMAIWFSRRLSEPVARLRQAVRLIAERRGDIAEAGILAVDSNITEIQDLTRDLERMREQLLSQTSKLEFQAYHDALTLLPNRVLLEDRVGQVVTASKRHNKQFSLLLLDLDKFKEVNDTLGHHVGDQLLCMLANRVQRSMRNMDTFARLSGDEFSILLIDTDEKQSLEVVIKINDLLQRPFTVDDHSFHVAASIGIAVYPDHAESYSGLLQCADIAMYHAKYQGHGHSIYHSAMDHMDQSRIGLASELRHAIQHDELTLYYQPKVNLKTNKIDCVEALVRWEHPERGLLFPDEFIHVAEKSTLINTMTHYILEQAIRQCQQWRTQGLKMSMAVNLSARNLSDSTLLDTLQSLLQKYQLDPTCLELEVTESMVMSDPERAKEVLSRIMAMNIKVVVDDFGSGYTSLSQLVSLPVSMIKIDKSFVLNMLESDSHQAIVKSVIELSQSLGKTVVSEGVEDSKTMEAIRGLRADQAQGFHICSPVPPEKLLDWFGTQNEFSVDWKTG